MSSSELEGVAKAMVAKDKGLLAADESNSTIAKRLAKIGTESTEEQRRTYRELLFTAPGIAQWISGVILYDETIRQKTRDGVPFPDYLTKLGIIPGIKVDTGAKPLAGFAGETITEGLDGLRVGRRPTVDTVVGVLGDRPALGALHIGRGEAKAWTDLIGRDLDLGAVLTLLGLPAALLQAARDDHAHALGEGEGHVLGQIPPAHDVKEGGRLRPLLSAAVLPASVDGHAKLGRRLAFLRVANLGFPGQVAGDRNGVAHGFAPMLLASFLANDAAASIA